MPFNPAENYRENIRILEEEQKSVVELSPRWYDINEKIRMYMQMIEDVERDLRSGVKY